ncbi:substrate-binding periplasmic protein [Massilia glaciei]|uniref:ABC transporter substrate-binding protein n=1 Tax=Massilia glaciei TaxID=1524097 RepID=A0A2U2HEY1_9BURK|nr:transporter substrate-binding domain-containing protein [Massilia glaciei]PWF42450.1 ABC transporter substrate-binding protein [Massilia glaciei]
MLSFRLPISCVLLACALNAQAHTVALVVLVDTATEMPMASFKQFRLVDGIHKDIGEALAARMGRSARFMALPRKRITKALETGEVDLVCSYVPEWLPGRFGWSIPFIPITQVLITRSDATRPRKLADLKGRRVGTVLGYSHPELEQALGDGFLREDAPSSEANLSKLTAGRIQHAVTGKSFIEYRLKKSDPPLALHPPLDVTQYMGQCAVSPKGRVTLAEVDAALTQMVHDGTINTIVAHYR